MLQILPLSTIPMYAAFASPFLLPSQTLTGLSIRKGGWKFCISNKTWGQLFYTSLYLCDQIKGKGQRLLWTLIYTHEVMPASRVVRIAPGGGEGGGGRGGVRHDGRDDDDEADGADRRGEGSDHDPCCMK